MHGEHISIYVRLVQRMQSTRRYTLHTLLRTHCGEISLSLFTLQISTIPSLLMRQNFSLMSNSRTDFPFPFPHHISLLLPPPPSLSLSLFSLYRTRLLHLCHCGCPSFWISTYASRGQKRERNEEEKRTYLSIPRHVSNTVLLLVQKRTLAKKGPTRSRVFRRAINWSAPLCSSRCEKEREYRAGHRLLRGIRGLLFHPFPSGSYSHRRTLDDEEGKRRAMKDARRTDIN